MMTLPADIIPQVRVKRRARAWRRKERKHGNLKARDFTDTGITRLGATVENDRARIIGQRLRMAQGAIIARPKAPEGLSSAYVNKRIAVKVFPIFVR